MCFLKSSCALLMLAFTGKESNKHFSQLWTNKDNVAQKCKTCKKKKKVTQNSLIIYPELFSEVIQSC